MITVESTRGNLLEVKLPQRIEAGDFVALESEVDELLAKESHARLLLDARQFEGWENFKAAEEHFKFIKNHQKKIQRAALLVSASPENDTRQHWIAALANTLLSAEVKAFDNEVEAIAWLNQVQPPH